MNLMYSVYNGDENFKINCEEIILDLFENKGTFCNNAEIISVGVYERSSLIAGCFLAIPTSYKESVLICFFEALPNYQQAVNLIINYAKDIGRDRNCKRL